MQELKDTDDNISNNPAEEKNLKIKDKVFTYEASSDQHSISSDGDGRSSNMIELRHPLFFPQGRTQMTPILVACFTANILQLCFVQLSLGGCRGRG